MKNIFILVIISTVLSYHFIIPIDYFNKEKIETDSLASVKISFVGDLMCHSPQIEFAKISEDSFDFNPTFSEVKKYLTESDLTIGNLETTISGKESKYSGYPLFNSPDEYLEALKNTGFDLLFTSNNHSLDRGKKGVLRTLAKIKDYGMNSTGSFLSQQDRDSIRVFDVNGIRIAFLAYTYGLNGNYLSKNEKYLVNVSDSVLIKNDIANARQKNSDVIIVYFHFGNEYQRYPSEFQKEIAKRSVEYGANIIIGSHPHVIQPVEYINSNKNKIGKSLVVYSLGNFISNQRWRYSDAGVILNLTITKNKSSQSISLSKTDFIPTWVFKGQIANRNEFVILPADSLSFLSLPEYLSDSEKAQLIQAGKDAYKMVDSTKNKLNK